MALAGELHPHAKLTEDDVEGIVWRYRQGGCTYQSLAEEYGVESGTISYILRGKTWRHVTGGEPVKAPLPGLATHCGEGHEFTPENTIWAKQRADRPNPARACRKCKNAYVRRYARAKRGNFR